MNIPTYYPLQYKKYYLSDQMEQRSNNLEVIKFVAAMLVIVHHAFVLTLNPNDWGMIITGGQFDLGEMAVSIFFFTSGLFIAKSIEKSKTCKKFATARFSRIWPSLFVIVTLCVLIGVIFSTLSPKEYFSTIDTYKYFLNAIFVLHHNLPGVFENNPYASTVNGALWTLPVEILCYIACFALYKLNLLKKKKILIIMALYLVCAATCYWLFTMLGMELLIGVLRPVYLFLLGNVLYVYRDRVLLDVRLFAFSLFGMVLCFLISLPLLAIWIFYPYIILYLSFMKTQCHQSYSRVGKYSYCIYLCAFPIQQAIIDVQSMNAYVNMLESSVCAVIAGVLLYHFVEKPATQYINISNKIKHPY